MLLMQFSFVAVQERELKLRRQLDKLRTQRCLLRQHRRKRQFPIIAVVGYTNAGDVPASLSRFCLTVIVILSLLSVSIYNLLKFIIGDTG